MFIGHFALGFAAKRLTPRVSLAALFVAAQFADLLWPALVAIGLEQVRIDPGNTASTPLDFVSYPWSHSLLMLVCWGAVFGWACRRIVPDRGVFAGVWIYARSTAARDGVGRWGFVGVALFLFLGFMVNGATPPPSITALWMMALVLGWLTIALTWWADWHRTARRPGR